MLALKSRLLLNVASTIAHIKAGIQFSFSGINLSRSGETARICIRITSLKRTIVNARASSKAGLYGKTQRGKSVVIVSDENNVENNAVVQGTPAFSYNSYNKSYVHFKNLPEIIKKFDSSVEKKNKK